MKFQELAIMSVIVVELVFGKITCDSRKPSLGLCGLVKVRGDFY